MSLLDAARNLVYTLTGSTFPTVSVTSTVDGKTYRVRDLPDKQAAADRLATVRLRLSTLCDALESAYPDKPQVRQMVRNFRADPHRFLEATPDEEHTSSTVNKGESIHICLRQRGGPDESLVPENVIMFVSLHEMAHIATESIGHGPDFWNNFGWLLKEAERLGLYQYTDFAAHPVSYCGVYITDAPSYDPKKDGTELQVGKMFKRTEKR
jgi:hypothetical protein